MNKTLEKVIAYIKKAIAEHPIKEEGKSYLRTIRYANSNDGTDFDWACNDRTCEFYVFYDTGEDALGYIKAYVCKDGTISGYVWDTERWENGIKLEDEPLATPEEIERSRHEWWKKPIAEARAYRFRNWLMKNFDKANLFDKDIATL